MISNIYFESEIDDNNNVTKVNFVNNLNMTKIITPNNILINNYKNLLNLCFLFFIHFHFYFHFHFHFHYHLSLMTL